MDATEKLIQATFQEVDLFDVEAAVSAGDEASRADARASVDSLLDSLTPALRGAVRSGFGLDGDPAISGSTDLLARALSPASSPAKRGRQGRGSDIAAS